MIRVTAVLGLVILLLFVGCSPKSSSNSETTPEEIILPDQTASVALEKEKEFEFDLISKGGPIFVRVNDEEHLYVAVLQNIEGHCEILKYSSADFKIKSRRVIHRGQGPMEALNPRFLGGDTQTIIVYDVAGNKYLLFDSKLTYVDEFKVKPIGEYGNSGGMYISKSRIVVDMFMELPNIGPIGRHLLFSRDFYNSRDTELFEIKAPWTKQSPGNLIYVISRPMHFTVLNEYCYILNKRDYRIIKMRFNGQIEKDIKIKFKATAFPQTVRKKWIARMNKNARLAAHMDYEEKLYPVVWIIPFFDGILIGRCTDHSPDNNGPVIADYFDKDLSYKGSVELPYFKAWNNPSSGSRVAANRFHYSAGKLYFIDSPSDDEYLISQWNIKIGEN